ncbi:MAG: hypothetical protein O6768_08080 [Planctomycetota bacterium]|nr:hypothetical protein [Planctomycetota bacterium]
MPAPLHQLLRTRLGILGAAALITLLAVGLLAISRLGSPAAEPAPTLHPAQIQPPPPVLGFAINVHHISDLSRYLGAIDEIAELGANALLVVTPMYQQRIDSTQIQLLPDKCPTDDQLIAILTHARSRGLYTSLLPIVLIEFPQEKDWRGVIQPGDWDAWWESYDRFIDRFLGIAVAAEVDLLSVGSELNSTEGDLEQWRRIVDGCRRRFDGKLTYSANWDRYEQVTFWPLVDVISVSAYFELAKDDPNASVKKLAKAWGRQRDKLLQFAGRYDRPCLLMELGYPSLPWAAAHPWNYVAGVGVTADHDAQARCYRGFFQAWSDVLAQPDSGALGLYCYLWDPYGQGQATDTGYGVRGKPALRIITSGFRRIYQSVTENSD